MKDTPYNRGLLTPYGPRRHVRITFLDEIGVIEMMSKRVLVKWLHWVVFALMLYFFIDEPEVRGGGDARGQMLSLHAGMGMILGVVTLFWTVIYFRGGPLGRPGPKLQGWGKRAHRLVNTGLYWLVPLTVISGGLAGMAADYPVNGFGIVPLNPAGWGAPGLHDTMEEVHEIVFDATILLILAHTLFHVWRHVGLKDNALRIMTPKALHRWL